ncbi:MAG: bifunctional 23S rRNA (guanine(2069)-N(7))-methyltransferase RlmK/23S rRNA (guanine(2445)-N(2))-methyltransferase RlmL [Dokdonella sp.]|uniref:bifunctional 23S rRNA (guanine(2069)-N(7))-methyltransferase RlmK/23S rRNA (guanine(2445)-N(2))-methyltransferase RlmL n=1 Tax=Dokdonella sp. TaxID=2291710 RepID=UPI0025C3E728|nr:bifunctional 23S rRNA (guanine(2069)-N(7))-methyltransferase RlmK/23S rRNA (guanine(2445)-N(2))-methyltransferase RlmL [Dokdonella sp.]MBX3700588.1 bifunctional 23S rRNA (guanine(2069)-N(7))-methyltransferase RlmK/23S rRNA (guanine(2445)-N(2))-methyltransferase RlmL [Dokdonella sp.]
MARYFATCPKGMEYLLRDELSALGAGDAHEALAGVAFSGELALAYRACLWSRLASRVLLLLADFEAADAEALYAGVRAIDWEQHLAVDGSFAVDAVGGGDALRNSQFVALRSKDAIVDQFRERHGTRPDVDTERPALRVNVRLHKGRAGVAIDLAGTPLHRRGWRQGTGEAPLKENLAAAILLRGGWPALAATGAGLVDPMCGSATLLIEGACMAADVAPGLQRDHFGFLGWRGHDAASWQALREEAEQRAQHGLRTLGRVFHGYDSDPLVLKQARHNVQAAGLAGFIQLTRQSVERLQRPDGMATGLVVCNPPYGERLGEREALAPLYRSLGERLRTQFVGWQAAVIVADDELGHVLGLRAHKRYTLYNGAIECRLLNFDLAQTAPAERETRPLSAGAQALANRLAKTSRHQRKQLAREGITCWRAYDADLPDYAAAIDVFTVIGRDDAPAPVAPGSAPFPQTWLHVQEYAPPREIPEDTARTRLRELVRVAGETFAVPRERIALKTRYKAKGGSKYGRLAQRGQFLLVEEGGLRFRVNLFDYLDTGLFLDHRPMRAQVRARARGQRFLNLFCYTGAVSVCAAAGGAATTTSVDLSATYLEWATRNFTLNAIGGPHHQLVQADALAWLRHARGQYDLIYVDPPSFSNSKRADDFDVQRGHAELLLLCGQRLAPGGVILFSNNLRRFRLDESLQQVFEVRTTTAATIPFDFARDGHVHHSYELRQRAVELAKT